MNTYLQPVQAKYHLNKYCKISSFNSPHFCLSALAVGKQWREQGRAEAGRVSWKQLLCAGADRLGVPADE